MSFALTGLGRKRSLTFGQLSERVGQALYVNESFVTRIVELDRLESAAVLDMLFRHVERPDFCMRWHWSANDIAFWDNRCVQHYAVPDYTASRVMQRIVLAGVRPGEQSSFAPRGKAMAA